MRAKEFLSVRGIDYDSIDVTKNPARLDAAVAKFGLKVLPLVVRGGRAINGQNLSDLASLIDESYDDTPVLAPDALVARTDEFLAACRRYAAQFPPDLFNAQLPYRDWDYRKLVHHVFHISEVFVNQMSGAGEPPGAAFEMPIPDSLNSFAALIEYGEEKRSALAAWWASPDRLDMNV